MNTKEHFLSKHGSKILLGLLIVFAVGSNWGWIQLDTGLGSDADSKDYIIRTITQLDTLQSTSQTLVNWLKELSHGGRSPLYQLLSMPFILLFGRSMDSGLIINLVFQTLLIALVYLIGKMISNSRTGLLAALFVASYPPLLQMSRIYTPHFALAACVALSLWRAFALLGNRSPRNVWWFVLSLAFGILIHPKIAGIVLIPVPIFSLYVVFFQDEPRMPWSIKELPKWLWAKLSDRIVWAGFLPAIILAVIPVFAWYLTLGKGVFNSFERIMSDELADFRGYDFYTRGFRDYPSYVWYLLTMPYALSNVLTLLFGAGLIYSVLKRDINHIVLLVAFTGAYIVNASYKTLAWVNFAPVLPIVALITATWIGEIKNKRIAWMLTSLAVVSSLWIFSVVTWGTSGIGIKIAQALSSPIDENGVCPQGNRVFCPDPAMQQDDWHINEIRAVVENDMRNGCRESKCVFLVIPKRSDFTAQYFTYYTLIENLSVKKRFEFRGLPLNLFSIQPFDFDLFLNNTYLFYVTNEEKKGHAYEKAAKIFLAAPPASFSESHRVLKTFDLQNGLQIRLLKRIKPISVREAEDTIRAIEIEEKYKYQQYTVLAPLYAQAGQFDKALQSYQKAIGYKPTDAGLYFGLAVVYESLGKMEEASSAYQQVIAIAPGSSLAHQAQAWLDSR